MPSVMMHKVKNEAVAFLGEGVGTFFFLFIAFFATQIANSTTSTADTANSPNISALMFISTAFGFSLLVNVWVFFRISGGLFNPAVAISLMLAGAIGPVRLVVTVTAQFLASIAAAGIVKGLLPGHPPLRFLVSLGSGMKVEQGLFLEMFMTANLILTILFLAAEKHKATYIAPVGIGLSLFICELGSVYYTGGALNPARAFGPCVVEGDFPGYHWIYWLGPVFGSGVASAFYHLNKFMNYEEANPGQDKNEDPGTNPETAHVTRNDNGDIVDEEKGRASSRGHDANSPNRRHDSYRRSGDGGRTQPIGHTF